MTGYPVLVNDAAMTKFAKKIALDTVGAERVIDLQRSYTGSADFSYMLEKKPGSYLVLGAKNARSQPLHHPGYDFNASILHTGAAYWVDLARAFLKAG